MSRVGRRRKKTASPKAAAWVRSAEFREARRRGWALSLATRSAAPKCGAKTKVTGEPCKQPAMANGRCRYHGGRTPKGDQWHRVQVERPRSERNLALVDRKLAKREAEAAARKRAVERMTPVERERHEAWQRTHKPGSAAKRAAARAEKQNDDWFRGVVEGITTEPDDEEWRRLLS